MSFSFSRARMTGAALTALALTAFLGAVPAQAHDALPSSNPADGQTITTNPGKVSITLNNPPSTQLKGSNIIKVTAPDGHVVSTGDLAVDGATLSTEADIDHPGKHTVQWRAVSADGHPIEGSFTFTFAGADEHASSEATTASAQATAAPSVTAPAAGASTPATQATSEPATQTAGSNNDTGWLIGAGVIIVALAVALAFALRRRRNTES